MVYAAAVFSFDLDYLGESLPFLFVIPPLSCVPLPFSLFSNCGYMVCATAFCF
jgi:hypothetical protein